MKKSKIKNIVIDKISKNTFGGSQNELLISRVVDETLKAINYSQCCKSDSEQLCECKKHSIKTNYGFEICTKCGNEFDD